MNLKRRIESKTLRSEQNSQDEVDGKTHRHEDMCYFFSAHVCIQKVESCRERRCTLVHSPRILRRGFPKIPSQALPDKPLHETHVIPGPIHKGAVLLLLVYQAVEALSV